jgi:adenylosuccinate synthase
VIDAPALLKEIEGLKTKSISCEGRLFISDRAHLVLPYHKAQDAGREAGKGGETKIGTTRRGIGPTYGDKANRTGLRCSDLALPGLAEKVRAKVEEKNLVLAALGVDTLDVAQVVDEMVRTAAALKGHVADTAVLLNEAIRRGEKVFFEGAQGTMLDIDHGTYPFVTSSNATSGGATTGTGVPPNRIKEVIGICKAYTTRVGEGPFPTELTEELGEKMGRIGAEFGATTGRKRRCGWFDAVVARHAVMINGVDWWTITKMDVLDTFETLRICTHYELDGRRADHIPADIHEFARCRPVYEDHPGWMTSTKGITAFDQLPRKPSFAEAKGLADGTISHDLHSRCQARRRRAPPRGHHHGWQWPLGQTTRPVAPQGPPGRRQVGAGGAGDRAGGRRTIPHALCLLGGKLDSSQG